MKMACCWVTLLLMLGALAGQVLTGWHDHDDLRRLGLAALTLPYYLRLGHLLKATFKTWESEFCR